MFCTDIIINLQTSNGTVSKNEVIERYYSRYLKLMFINLSAFLVLILLDIVLIAPIFYLDYVNNLWIAFWCFFINDGIMFITICLILYEWYFVVTNQDNYACQVITTNLWKLCAMVSISAHTIGMIYWFSFSDDQYIFIYFSWDIGCLHSILLWFLCFCWEYYKMSRRSFADLVNRNLNLSSFILEATCITIFEACINIIPIVDRHIFKFNNLVAFAIGSFLTIVGLVIIFAKMYVFRKRQRKESIVSTKSGIIVDKFVGLALIIIMTGVITNISSSYTQLLYLCQFHEDFFQFYCLLQYWQIYEFACSEFSLFFGCFVIFFNVISVIIP